MLPVRIASSRNRLVGDHAHFSLIQVRSNGISIVFCPILGCTLLRRFSSGRRRLLGSNGTIITSIASPRKAVVGTFIRVSPRAGRIVGIPAPIVNHGLRILSRRLNLNDTRVGAVRGNRPLAFIVSSRPIAINVSLGDGANVHFTRNSRRR